MTGKTTIEWTAMPGYVGAVWNPTTGCTRVSAGCDNCYAFALHDKRFKTNLDAAHRDGYSGRPRTDEYAPANARAHGAKLPWPKQYDLPFSRVQLLEERLDVPLRTRKPTSYFVDSMADLFHEDVPDEFIARIFDSMRLAAQHRFLILTKRPERMKDLVAHMGERGGAYDFTEDDGVWPLPNVWLGTSVEDQASADERVPHLIATPAAVRFLSCEPLLGPIELTSVDRGLNIYGHSGRPCHVERIGYHRLGEGLAKFDGRKPPIDWVIAGGESGPRARPMDLAWARSLRDHCAAAGVSFFMKQLGSAPGYMCDDGSHPGERHVWPARESHGRDVAEWPEDLRIRTWPR